MLTVNLYLWLASRFMPLRFWRNLLHQLWSLAALLALAFACREASLLAGLGGVESLPRFFLSGVLYSGCAILVAALLPAFLGLSRQEVRELIVRFRRRQR